MFDQRRRCHNQATRGHSPERFGLGRANVHPENLTQAVAVDTYHEVIGAERCAGFKRKAKIEAWLASSRREAWLRERARDERRLYIILSLIYETNQ